MENQEKVHKRRVRYSGTHPRNYKEKYRYQYKTSKQYNEVILNDEQKNAVNKVNAEKGLFVAASQSYLKRKTAIKKKTPFILEAETREEMLESKKERKIINELNLEMEVVRLGADYWREVLKWGLERKLINPIEQSFLEVATNFDKTFKIVLLFFTITFIIPKIQKKQVKAIVKRKIFQKRFSITELLIKNSKTFTELKS